MPPVTVRLKDIVDALEMQIEDHPAHLDLDTGQVRFIDLDLLRRAEDDSAGTPNLPEWQKPEWKIVKTMTENPDRFLELPTKFDVHEWQIMNDFANSAESPKLRDDLLDSIHGAGAFRQFKSTLHRHNLESAWYAFRTEALRQIAIDWCHENLVAWT